MRDIFKIDNINNYNNDFYERVLKIIKKEKQEKIKKLVNQDDKKRSILGEYLLIESLKELKIDYDKINIKYNKNNKPYIENNNIFYNISHKGIYSCIIVSAKEVGIDIEEIKEFNKDILKYISSENEKRYINNNIDYYKLYTLKEAYFKMLGEDLFNLKSIEFILNNKEIITKENIKIKTKIINNYFISIIKSAN